MPIIELYAGNNAAGFGDIANTLTTAVWFTYFNLASGNQDQVRITIDPSHQQEVDDTSVSVAYTTDRLIAFMQKFYGASDLGEIIKACNQMALDGKIELPPGCKPLPANFDYSKIKLPSVYYSNDSYISPPQVLVVGPNRELPAIIYLNALNKIIITAEYDLIIHQDAVFNHVSLSEGIPEIDSNGNYNSAKFIKMLCGLREGANILTALPPLPLDVRYDPKNLKEINGYDKVGLAYITWGVYLNDWIEQLCMDAKGRVAIIVAGANNSDTPPASDILEAIAEMRESGVDLPEIDLITPGFIPNPQFSGLLQSKYLDNAVVTGDNSLGALMAYYPAGKPFAYEIADHKHPLAFELLDMYDMPVSSGADVELAMFESKVDFPEKAGLESEIYTRALNLAPKTNDKPEDFKFTIQVPNDIKKRETGVIWHHDAARGLNLIWISAPNMRSAVCEPHINLYKSLEPGLVAHFIPDFSGNMNDILCFNLHDCSISKTMEILGKVKDNHTKEPIFKKELIGLLQEHLDIESEKNKSKNRILN